MARPKNADPERTKQAVLEAAVRLFGERGLSAVSIRDIAAQANVTLATVHHYFGSKDSLYVRCLETTYARLSVLQVELTAEAGRVANENGASPAAVIAAITRTCFRFGVRHAVASRFLLRATLFESDAPERGRVRASQVSFLDTASRVLGPLLGREPDSLRVPLQGLMFLITRMVVSNDEELIAIGGDPQKTQDDFERYLVEVATHSLVQPAGRDQSTPIEPAVAR